MYSNGASFGASNSQNIGDSKNYELVAGGHSLGGLYIKLLSVNGDVPNLTR